MESVLFSNSNNSNVPVVFARLFWRSFSPLNNSNSSNNAPEEFALFSNNSNNNNVQEVFALLNNRNRNHNSNVLVESVL